MKKKCTHSRFRSECAGNLLKKMKLLIAFFFAGLLGVSASTYSQQTKFNMKVDEATVKEVFKLIEEKSEFVFFYNEDFVDVNRKVNINATNEKVESILDELFKGTENSYKIYDRQIVILSPEMKNMPTLIKSETDSQQKREIYGTIRDSKGQPLPGTTVIVKGTTIGIVTDIEGKFKLSIPADAKVLAISFIGMKSQEIQINGNINFDVVLLDETLGVDEVVIVGYGVQKKATITGAIASISGKLLVQSPVANISNALVGRLPGLLAIQSSGEPGADISTLRIRGTSTFSGSTDPLIMVDGIEAQNYNNIDPNDIENMTILKDASATAVYGVRGANGVLLITTKRGQIGKPKVSFTSNYAITSFSDLSQNTNAYQYSTMYNEALKYDSYISGGYTPKYSAEDIRLYQTHEDPIFHPDKNWYKELLRPSSGQTQNNINISGGTKKVKYFVSAGYFSQQGLINTTDYNAGYDPQIHFNRYNFRANFDFEITNRLSATINISTQIETRKGRNETNQNTSSLISAVASANPVNYPGLIDGKVADIGALSILSSPYFYLFASGFQQAYTNYLNGMVRLNYKLDSITLGLSSHASLSYQNYNSQLGVYQNNYVPYTATKLPDNSIVLVPKSEQSPFSYTESVNKNRKQYAEFGLDYARSFGHHNISALLLYNQSKYFSPSLAYLIPNGYQGVVGRIAYDYKGRYMAEYDLGYNGTENFAPGKRYGFFPAYSLGWVLSQESFFPKNDYLSFVKLRLSYGEVGNDKIGGDRFLYRPSSYVYSDSYRFGEVGSSYNTYNASNEGKIGNPDLTWERAKKTDIGLELGLLQDKIKISADIFQERRDNILANMGTVPIIVGANLPAYNLGKMKNKGFDGDVTFNNKAGNFNYWVKANFTYATNVIEFQDEVKRTFSYQYRTGQRVGQFFGLVAEGLYNTWAEVNDPSRPISIWNNNKIQPGDIRYKDVNGDGKIDADDAVPIGYSNFPEQIFGISFGGQYKGFDFSALIQGAGRYSHQYSGRNQVSFGNGGSTNIAMLESWSQERYEQGFPINFPHLAVETAVQQHNYQPSSFWIKDSGYLRLKNMEIGYTMSNRFLTRKLGLESMRVYVNGNNILTFDKLIPGIDPEQTFGVYPMTKIVNIGFSVKL
jgi:TonB-linked SusC/RagA family outer membrane protein